MAEAGDEGEAEEGLMPRPVLVALVDLLALLTRPQSLPVFANLPRFSCFFFNSITAR